VKLLGNNHDIVHLKTVFKTKEIFYSRLTSLDENFVIGNRGETLIEGESEMKDIDKTESEEGI
jgi:hypothetical protein